MRPSLDNNHTTPEGRRIDYVQQHIFNKVDERMLTVGVTELFASL
jgi:hypothetical protein